MPEQADKSAEQKGAEANVESFEKALGPFVVAAETTRMPMVFTDAKSPGNAIIFANDAFLSLTGYDRPEVLGQGFNFLMERGTDPEALAQIKTAFEANPDVDPEIRYRRKDGSEFWASVMINPVRDKSGDVIQHFASFVDLTRHKEYQHRSQLLIHELNHRVKNVMFTVQSIVRQALRSGSDAKVIRESVDSRLRALARSHDLLTQEKWESAGLLDMVDAAMKPFVAEGRAERFVVTGENIRVQPAAVLSLGVALHELATNAVKYGAFSNEAGRILMGWEIVASPKGDRLNLHWQETGGPAVSPPSRKGFGSTVIIAGLAHELGGEVNLDFPVEGAVCTINIPAPAPAHHEE